MNDKLVVDNWDKHWAELSKEIYFKTPAVVYRWNNIVKLLGMVEQVNKKVLDIGCGTGYLLKFLKDKNSSICLMGVDNSKLGLDIAKKEIPEGIFFQSDLTVDDLSLLYPELNGGADFAVCSEVLEHLDDPVQFLKNIKYFLHPESVLVITVPGGPMGEFDKLIGHRKHYSKELLHHEITEAGLKVEEICCAGFPFYNVYRLLMLLKAGSLYKNSDKKDISQSKLVKIGMKIFTFLFNFNFLNNRFGWSILAKVTL